MDRPSLTNRYWPLSPYSPKRFLLSSQEVDPEPGWELLRSVSPESMSYLLMESVTSLLVEGGAETLRAFLEADLWDEISVEQVPDVTLGEGVKAPSLDALTPDRVLLRDRHRLCHYTRE